MTSAVIRGTLRLVLIPLALFAVVAVSAPMPNALIKAAWLIAAFAFFGWLGRRIWRAGVQSDLNGIIVRNIGRSYIIPWHEVEELSVERSNNVSGLVKCVVVHRRDGTGVIARAASSYSRSRVETWREQLETPRPRP